MYTKHEIIQLARKQLALDFNCNPSDFDKEGNLITENILRKGRRIYKNDGAYLKVLCFNGKAVITADKEIIPWCKEKLLDISAPWFFQYPILRGIDKKINEYGHKVADAHHYYLPNTDKVMVKNNFKVKWFEEADIKQFEGDDRFDEAFAFEATHPDVLAVAAMDGDKIMGMAGASADGEDLWQIGIDVLPEYRGRGIATSLVILLKEEILRRGKIPFYGTVESHIYSQNVAINAGFYPAWAELYSKTV